MKVKTKYLLISVFLIISVIILSCDDKSTDSSVPNAPSDLVGLSLSSSAIQLYWVDNSANEKSFLIYRSINNGWNQIATAPANSNSHTDSLLQDSTTYFYYLVAKNEMGASITTDTLSVSTLSIDDAPNFPNNPNPPDSSINVPIDTCLSWNCADPDGDTLKYDIYFGDVENPPLVEDNYPENIYILENLNYSTNYYWKVVAKDNFKHQTEGPLWNFSTIINYPPNEPFNPIPPEGALLNDSTIQLSWDCSDPENDLLTSLLQNPQY